MDHDDTELPGGELAGLELMTTDAVQIIKTRIYFRDMDAWFPYYGDD
jgi:hypothetical protein